MKILFISSLIEKESRPNDFMQDIVLHGMREIFGDSVIDYPGAWYMYRDEVKKRNYDISNLWGKGFTLYNLLSNYEKIDRTDIEKKIKDNYFDFIIFGSIHKPRIFFNEAIKLVGMHQQGSISLIQRRLKVGYSRAARLIDDMEQVGIVGPFTGSKAREVLVDESYLETLE